MKKNAALMKILQALLFELSAQTVSLILLQDLILKVYIHPTFNFACRLLLSRHHFKFHPLMIATNATSNPSFICRKVYKKLRSDKRQQFLTALKKAVRWDTHRSEQYIETLINKQDRNIYNYGIYIKEMEPQLYLRKQTSQHFNCPAVPSDLGKYYEMIYIKDKKGAETQGQVSYLCSQAASYSEPFTLMSMLGYLEVAKYSIKEEVFESLRFRCSVRVSEKLPIVEFREYKELETDEETTVDILLRLLQGYLSEVDSIMPQRFRPCEMQVGKL